MLSRSLVGAMMQVKVGIGSCAICGENIETSWVTFAWRFGALNVESQCSWAVVQVTLRLRTRCCAQDTAEARGDATGAVLGQG